LPPGIFEGYDDGRSTLGARGSTLGARRSGQRSTTLDDTDALPVMGVAAFLSSFSFEGGETAGCSHSKAL